MKHFSKIAIMTICLIITALFTTACGGGGGKATPSNNSTLFFLLANNNNQQQENNQNQEQNNNNQQEENNNKDPVATTDITLTLTDSKDADKIATADIYYSVDNTKKRGGGNSQESNDEEDSNSVNNTITTADETEDKEILKAEPTAEDKTKFKLTDNIDITNAKIKAVLTYDSEGNLLDYFSSYDGVEATNSNFNVDFGNSADNEDGFADGDGSADNPFKISAPRHFVSINKKDAQGAYLYMDKHFQQTEDLDFTHLIGLKIVNADDDKDITIEENNKKAPFYNEGHGITPIAEAINNEETIELKGTYDGTEHVIDGIYLVNPQQNTIGLFTRLTDGNIKNLTIGKNSIIFIDKNNENYSNNIILGGLVGFSKNSTFENCTNNEKIIIKNIQTNSCFINGLTHSNSYDCELKNCTNNGNITIDNCTINRDLNIIGIVYCPKNIENSTNKGNITLNNSTTKNTFVIGISTNSTYNKNCANEGNITIANNNINNIAYIEGVFLQAEDVTDCNNKGNINITENKIDGPLFALGIASYFTTGTNCTNGTDGTNDGKIDVTNNTLNSIVYISGIAYSANSTMTNCINNGDITVNNNITKQGLPFDVNGLLNVEMDPDKMTNCVNNGIITINGVVQP